MAKLCLAGYFGCGNLGDDAILAGFLEGLAARPHEVTVLSGEPDETYRQHKVSAVPRRDMGAVKKAIEAADALVFPGGSIFQDVSSAMSPMYYANLVKTAKGAKKKVALLGQGVGPINGFFGKKWTAGAFNSADGIAVRDPGSMATLKSLGVNKPIHLTADLAFLLPPPFQEESSGGFQVGSMTSIGISARPLKSGPNVADLFGEFARQLYAGGHVPTLIEMDQEEDGALILEIAKRNGGKVPDLRKQGRPQQIQARLARMEGVVAVRLHAGILAATVGIPPLMVSYDPKVTAFAKLLDVPCVPIEGLTPTRLFETFKTYMADLPKLRERMVVRRDEQIALARKNFDVLDGALGIAKIDGFPS